MTEQDQIWFDELAKDREDSAKTLEKPSMRGTKNSVVEKYSDQAHFIYELLQNANDANATKCLFQLTADGLYFKHNGKIHFSVSSPYKEDEDKKNNRLGHINSITAIGNSGKTESSIGKFGVGFKAVFQYTETPHIYDPNFQFKIERFIVPVKLENDLADRQKDETVFYFPFNKAKISAEKAHSDILGKLKKLVFPTLFLSNLQEIKWNADNETGEYTKKSDRQKQANGIIYEKLKLYQQIGLEQIEEKLYLFTRSTKEGNTYSIGYFLDKKGKLTPPKKNFPAFCFFPTKETTNLNFILHAPFLLTDSREGIHRSKEHNTEMVKLLAQLASDSLLILKDLKLLEDNIIEIIPYKKPTEGLFTPFYDEIKKTFETQEILPAKNGTYVKKDNAYWAFVPRIADLFSDEQLTDILKKENNKTSWIFPSKGRGEISRVNKELADYIDSVTNGCLNQEDILKDITGEFIEKQSIEWLISFYQWIAETDGRKKLSSGKPFFLNQNGKAVAVNAFYKTQLYLPDSNDNGEGYDTLNNEILEKTEKILAKQVKGKNEKESQAITFYKNFGINEYTVEDKINDVIEKFEDDDFDENSFFSVVYKYFKKECPQDEVDDFIERIEDFEFIPFYNNNEKGYSSCKNLFYPTDKLIEFYERKPDTMFVDIKHLQGKYSEKEHKTINKFLKALGVKDKDPDLKDEVYDIIIPKYNSSNSDDINNNSNDVKTLLKYYQECSSPENYSFCTKLKSLCFLSYKDKTTPNNKLFGKPQDLYYPTDELIIYFESKPDTKFVDLDDYYSFITEGKEQQILREFLLKIGVKELPKLFEQIKNTYYEQEFIYIYDGIEECIKLIDDSKKSIILWNILKRIEIEKLKSCTKKKRKDGRHNFSSELFDSPDLLKIREHKWLVNQNDEFVAPYEITINELADIYEKDSYEAKKLIEILQFKPLVILTETQRIASKFESEEEAEEARKALKEKRERENRKAERKTSTTDKAIDTADLDDAIESLDNLSESVKKPRNEKDKTNTLPDFDEDEAFSKGIEALKKQLEIKKSRVDLAESINNSIKYSYDWFKTYLQLLTTYVEKQDAQKQKSISFQEIKPYKADNKYFLLCGASSYISPEIENADDFKISLVFGGGKRENITVEGVSKKGQDLLIYCREPLSNNTLSRLSKVFKVEINFTPVIDLLDRLYKAFTNDNYVDKWEKIEEAMPSLNYIYGPPGTGKTTTLCNKINDILAKNPNAKFLVLTPTNKAADVVCKKLQALNANIDAVRLSRPTDPELEEAEIYRDTLDDKDIQSINVVASTIHRLPYFDIQKSGLLFQCDWDFVIFDEASMTGLHYITFAIMALFKTNSDTNFIIAGDPKQIPPVIEINDKELENFDFQDENIYKMMNLESFKPEEQKIRENDTIQNLDTQYRSIPQIGQLFSDLSYSSLLKHDRETNRKEVKQLPEQFKKLISSNVTFIDIPLKEDNSIYKVNKLFYSSYHIYCVILVSEIIKYFDTVNKDKEWTIGLIAPYKAQAILLSKLITSYGISENAKVFSDTVHGFQGDECDMVFFVCNPNNYFYSGHEKALLSKEYIYNVAISRAKDYLIILHPYTKIQNNNFINKIGLSYKKNFGNAKILNVKAIEKTLFNDEKYIENNSYVSGHDNVNVFGLSEMKYFIKANDTAIDIQLKPSI